MFYKSQILNICEYNIFKWYFGGGIQCTPHGIFAAQNNLPAQKLLHVGNTNKTRSELETFLRTIRHLYSMQTYDLINNNCNNFSDAVVRFLTSDSGNPIGIPSYIVDLPRIVFSTPGGAMLRPMIENMQRNIHNQNLGVNSLDPFGGSSSTISSASTSSTNTPISPFAPTFTTTATSAAASASVTVTPVANTMTAVEFENKLSDTIMSNIELIISENKGINTSSILLNPNLINTPVTLKDVGNIKVLIEKIISSIVSNKDLQGITDSEKNILKDDMANIINTLSIPLPAATDTTTTPIITPSLSLETYDLFLKYYFLDPSLQLSYLSVLRYLVLQPFIFPSSSVTTDIPTTTTTTKSGCNYTQDVIFSIAHDLSNPKGFKESVAIRTIAYSVLVNVLSHTAGAAFLLTSTSAATTSTTSDKKHKEIQSKLIDIIIEGLTHTKTAIKTMASALALNLTIAATFNETATGGVGCFWNKDTNDSELHSSAVQLLCCIVENIETETNDVIRQRELISLYRILLHCGMTARSLANDLGLNDIVSSLITNTVHQHHITTTATGVVSVSDEAVMRKNEALLIREIHKLLN